MTKSSLDHALLAARIMRPKRSDPWPVRKLLRGITDPAAAWAALAPQLPPALAHSTTRAFQPPFVLPPEGATDATPTPGRETASMPGTIPACLAIATDAPSMLATEAHAHEAVKRLALWGVTPRPHVLWTFVPEWPGADQGGEFLFSSVHASLPRAAEPNTRPDYSMRAAFTDTVNQLQAELAQHSMSPAALRACDRFLEACGRAAQWKRACELGLVAPPYEYAPGKIVAAAGTPFAELPDPFEPLLALLLLGYWLSGATDDALVLVGTELISQR